MLGWRLLRQTVIPWQTEHYYEEYYCGLAHYGLPWASIKQFFSPGQRRFEVFFIIAFLTVVILRMLLFFLLPTSDPLLSVVLFDFVALLDLDSHFNFCFIPIDLLAAYYFYLFYLCCEPRSAYICYQILVKRDKNFFLRQANSEHNPAHGIQRTALSVLNILQLFVVFIHFATVYLLYLSVSRIVKDGPTYLTNHWPRVNPLLGMLGLACIFTCCFAVTIIGAFYYFAHILILAADLGVGLLTAYKTKMHQITVWLERLVRSRANSKRSFRTGSWLRAYRRFVILVLHTNRQVGPMISGFFLTNYPTNCYFALSALYHQGSLMQKVFTWAVCVEQWIALLGLHLLIVSFNRSLTKPNNRLFGLTHRKAVRSRTHLTLNLHLQEFHTNKPYGFTYATVGPISMITFGKCALFYGELVMSIYAMVQTT